MNPAALNTFRSAILGQLAFTILTQPANMIRPVMTEIVATHYLVSLGNMRNWSEDGVLEQLEYSLL